ncbi:hypothetical protein AYI69_g34 [Smittium culicis]|uniref:Uncharacterized protein n=1 Tax=Smittium culicis TaxID=133412 RepID=A0A1R1YU94_9FUNG|nr:hypothetical protein AYI69_g34 [Smittium culicis]
MVQTLYSKKCNRTLPASPSLERIDSITAIITKYCMNITGADFIDGCTSDIELCRHPGGDTHGLLPRPRPPT